MTEHLFLRVGEGDGITKAALFDESGKQVGFLPFTEMRLYRGKNGEVLVDLTMEVKTTFGATGIALDPDTRCSVVLPMIRAQLIPASEAKDG